MEIFVCIQTYILYVCSEVCVIYMLTFGSCYLLLCALLMFYLKIK